MLKVCEELHNFREIVRGEAEHDFSEIVQLRAHFQCSPTGGAQFLVAVFRFAGAPNQEYFVV